MSAAGTIGTLEITNVHIVAADGGEGYAAGAPYTVRSLRLGPTICRITSINR